MYIGIDLGTTGCKTVMYDEMGNSLCEYNKEYELIFKDGFVEQDANMWWHLVREGLRFTVEKTGISDIKGISVSTQGISFVPVDRDGNTLYNALSWLDLRAEEQALRLRERFGEEYIFSITGKPCIADYSLPKLIWFYENRREIYDRTDKFLFPLDFLNLRLCGIPMTDYTVAGGTMLYDIHNMCWCPELLEFSGISEDKLPTVGCMGDEVGVLLPEVARECGIDEGCRVYLGGQDQKLAAIGAGIDKDCCTVSFGTATAISKLTDTVGENCCLFRFDRDSYITETALMTTGSALRWLSRNLFSGKSYREMDLLAEESVPGANGVTFKCDLTSGGAISGITLSTTGADIIYALYEGVSRDISKAVESMGGASSLKVFGGGAKSDIWCRILSRISSLPVEILNTSETASLGAARLASGGNIPPAKCRKIINE